MTLSLLPFKRCLLVWLAAAQLLVAAGGRPRCNGRTLGRLWPAEAERDARAANRLARCGRLLICTGSLWRHRWQPLAVRVDQLQKGVEARTPPACQEPPPDPRTGSGPPAF